jgi:BspA type Leucine rich repeat region (6 copies)/Immunoglobulin domain/Immunoglobulin I-set domain
MLHYTNVYRHIKLFIIFYITLGFLYSAKGITSGNLQFNYNSTNTGLIVTGGYGSTINIPASVSNYPVVAIGDNAFNGNSVLSQLTIPQSVTSIGSYAFAGCTSLTSVVLPINLKTIGDYAFQGTGISSLIIPPYVSSIGSNPVAMCKSITTLSVTNGSKYFCSINSAALYDIGQTTLIAYCPRAALGVAPIPQTVKTIGDYAFYGSNLGKTITLPNGLLSIGSYAFYNSSFTNLIIPRSVTSLGDFSFASDYPNRFLQLVFLGDVPVFGSYVFYYTQDVSIYYSNSAKGWSSPTIQGVPCTQFILPNAPTNLSATGMLNSINVSFSPPDNSANALVTGYVATATSTRVGTNITTNGLSSPIIIPNLYDAYSADAPTYYISLYATTKVGGSDPIAGASAVISSPIPAELSPQVLNQPVSQSVVLGSSVSMSVTASGGGLSYQWYKGSSAINGATAPTYNISTVQNSDAGSYYVIITNNVGSITSNIAILTITSVVTAPSISIQPISQSVNVGTSVTLSVIAAGTSPFTYQWYNGSSAILGATASSYTINSPEVKDSGSYYVTVANSSGTVTSNGATLTVNVVGPSITIQPLSLNVNAGGSATLSVTATGTAPFAYQWYKNNSAISGATNASFTIGSLVSSDAGSYTVSVSNSAATVTSNAASITVNNAPAITVQPISQTLNVGSGVTFSVSVSGTPPFTYQWYKDGVAILGATASTYTINNISSSDAASYSVAIVNTVNSVTSSPATLSVNLGPLITTQPVSQAINIGSTANFYISASGTGPLTYQWYKGSTAIAGATSSSYTINVVSSSDNGSYTVVVTNSVGSVTSSAATLVVNATPILITQPLGQTVNVGSSIALSVTANGASPLIYQWYKDGASVSGAVTTNYSIASAATTDAGSYSVVVANSLGIVTSNTAVVIVNSIPVIITQPVSQIVKTGSSVTLLVIANGTGALSYQWQKNGVSIAGATNASYMIPSALSTDSASYSVKVSNAFGSITSIPAVLTVASSISPPLITTQPSAQVTYIGSVATLTAVVTSTGDTTYQWYENGIAIAGATSPSYSVSNAKSIDTGIYTLVATNAAGSVTSTPVAIAVTNKPVATQTSQLVNVSCLQQLPQNGMLTTGFVIQGAQSIQVLIRVSGPALAAFGVPNPMSDPSLKLYDSNHNVIASNSGWGGSAALAEASNKVAAFPIQDLKSSDSAILVTLPVGAYTVQGASLSGASGALLLEVYQVPP